MAEYKDVAKIIVASQDSVSGERPFVEISHKLEEARKGKGGKIRSFLKSKIFHTKEDGITGEKKVLSPRKGAFASIIDAQGVSSKNIDLTDPREVAKMIIDLDDQQTYSAIDTEKVAEFNLRMKSLGKEIQKIDDNDTLGHLRDIIEGCQHFYTNERLGTFHNTIDIHEFVTKISNDEELLKANPNLKVVGEKVLEYMEIGQDGMIFKEKHMPYDHNENPHGLSLHVPTTPEPVRDSYTYFEDSRLDKETNWDAVNDHITSTRTISYLASSTYKYMSGLKQAAIDYAESLMG